MLVEQPVTRTEGRCRSSRVCLARPGSIMGREKQQVRTRWETAEGKGTKFRKKIAHRVLVVGQTIGEWFETGEQLLNFQLLWRPRTHCPVRPGACNIPLGHMTEKGHQGHMQPSA